VDALLRYLPGPQPIVVRYGITALLVMVAYGTRLGLGDYSGAYGFLFFILPVVASALMFDRGTGFFAVTASAVLVATLLDWGQRPVPHAIALLLFGLVGGCLVLIAEGLHRALEKAHAAHRATELLLEEMSHRVKNKFAMVSSIISLQARRSSPEARQALDDIARRVAIIAAVHDYLQLSREDGLIDTAEYVPRLCDALKGALSGASPVSITASAVAAKLPPQNALSVGLIVNELVTNAVKYAFTEGQPGNVHVELNRAEGRLVLTVRDDGRGYAPTSDAGLGTRLVSTFAAQLGGSAVWAENKDGGCAVIVEFPG